MGFLSALVAFLVSSRYALIFFGSYVEGSAVMMTTGLLWRLHLVEFWPAYLVLIASDTLADISWYALGRYAARSTLDRWGHRIGATPEVVQKIENRFHSYHLRVLVTSKLTMGFGFAPLVLLTAGTLRIPFGRYVTITVLGGIAWILFLLCVGFYVGDLIAYLPGRIKIALAVAIPLALFGAVYALQKKLAALIR